ncbi:unnamed protein product [Plutella xylostella]|uniref:(diamondback moth) hypothetical protein n=1 Tax=Plutella xylostella TaxID=51655 RepID=A0A8S4E5K5_PLUXY|nr:unnamed protein product [Plutella xylostella]
MTSPRRVKKSGAQCLQSSLDWDSPSAETGTVRRRRSCPDAARPAPRPADIAEVLTPTDSESGTSRSDKTDSLVEVEERISCIINENRSSQSNSESSEVDIIIDSILANPDESELFSNAQNEAFVSDRSKTFIKAQPEVRARGGSISMQPSTLERNKIKDRRLKAPTPIQKLNKSIDFIKNTPKLNKELPKVESKPSVLPVYRSTLQGQEVDLSASPKKKVVSKLRLPFSPTRTMDKPKSNYFQGKSPLDSKPTSFLSSPVRRTISNEYVRLKFSNDTLVRRTIHGKSVPKIMPKIQSIIPESPVDNEDPFLNLSPNKKYTVTVNNKVRCDKDNYVIFDPNTGFTPPQTSKSRLGSKPPSGDKSKIPLKSPVGERAGAGRPAVNVSDTDSGILSPSSPAETSADEACAYANAAAVRASAKRTAVSLDIQIVDPGLAKKATEQIKVSLNFFFKS